MRGLFYCQHLAGIGHLVRSLNICKSLVKEFDVDFIQGGPDVPHAPIDSPRFRKFQLPPIAHVPGKGIADPSGKLSLDELHRARKEVLLKKFREPCDFFATEFFPFSKLDFQNEILPLIQQLKGINPECLIISCVRDIMSYVLKNPEHETCRILHGFYDKVFVNSDPSIVRLEESFTLFSEIKDMAFYTGYVSEPALPKNAGNRKNSILVSMGGGFRGEELVRMAASVSVNFPHFKFLFVPGPNSPPMLERHLIEFQRKYGSSRLDVLAFVPGFEEMLANCRLSISLGGYNTVINVIHTRTPAIVYPALQDEEQMLRARKMAEKGLVHAIFPHELNPQSLTRTIQAALAAPYPKIDIDLSGAEKTTLELARLIKERKKRP